MGMFDSVMASCPKCGTVAEFQSKSGPCALLCFRLDQAPADVLCGAANFPHRCENCSTVFAIGIEVRASVFPWDDESPPAQKPAQS